MQHNSETSISSLPNDVLSIVLSLFPEAQFLGSLRLVCKRFKTVLDLLLTRPLNVLKIICELDPTNAVAFLAYYETSIAYLTLVKKVESKAPLSVEEKFCLACVGQHKNPEFLRKVFEECVKKLRGSEKLKLLNQLPLPIVNQFLNTMYDYEYGQYIQNKTEYLNGLVTRFLKNPDEQSSDIWFLEETLFNDVFFALSTNDIKKLNPEALTFAINSLMNVFKHKDNNDLIRFLPGLQVTMTALKHDKTEADWEIIRKGANTYINLAGVEFSNVNLKGAKFRGINLSNAKISHGDLTNADLVYATFNNTSIFDTVVTNVDLSNADLSNSFLYGITIKDSNLSGCKLKDPRLSNVIFDNTNLSDVCLTDIDFAWHRALKEEFVFVKCNLNQTRWFKRRKCPNLDLRSFMQDDIISSYTKIEIHPNRVALCGAIASDMVRILSKKDPACAYDILCDTTESPLYADELSGKMLFEAREKLRLLIENDDFKFTPRV